MDSRYLLPKLVSSLECPLRQRPVYCTKIWLSLQKTLIFLQAVSLSCFFFTRPIFTYRLFYHWIFWDNPGWDIFPSAATRQRTASSRCRKADVECCTFWTSIHPSKMADLEWKPEQTCGHIPGVLLPLWNIKSWRNSTFNVHACKGNILNSTVL